MVSRRGPHAAPWREEIDPTADAQARENQFYTVPPTPLLSFPLSGAREGRGQEGAADTPKIWSRGQKMALMSDRCQSNGNGFPLYCINDQHDFKRWHVNQVLSCYMKKLDF